MRRRPHAHAWPGCARPRASFSSPLSSWWPVGALPLPCTRAAARPVARSIANNRRAMCCASKLYNPETSRTHIVPARARCNYLPQQLIHISKDKACS
ncbi:hypothetical protein [Oryza sativa Japonica Group]|uniref:Uncharacterized protein n=1 Tax=Oryza sativa subsp. japonica TaxID=39947 RepID=Q5N8Q6_ORYSJ|nr:hypothetical protein [Oryza sativa Japonica Group]